MLVPWRACLSLKGAHLVRPEPGREGHCSNPTQGSRFAQSQDEKRRKESVEACVLGEFSSSTYHTLKMANVKANAVARFRPDEGLNVEVLRECVYSGARGDAQGFV